jgi:response regulator RpfG family c-di-GMP phosphodiesterase
MIRDDRYLRATPFILTGEIFDDRNTISEALEAGADDYLPAYFHAQYLVAKADWLIHRKYAHENMKEHYEVVRSRQSRIANVVKETSVLIRDLDLELKRGRLDMAETQEDRNNIDRRIGLGVGMIGAIADLLEEQVKAMNVWEPVPSVPAHSGYQYAGANIDEQKISHLVPDRF